MHLVGQNCNQGNHWMGQFSTHGRSLPPRQGRWRYHWSSRRAIQPRNSRCQSHRWRRRRASAWMQILSTGTRCSWNWTGNLSKRISYLPLLRDQDQPLQYSLCLWVPGVLRHWTLGHLCDQDGPCRWTVGASQQGRQDQGHLCWLLLRTEVIRNWTFWSMRDTEIENGGTCLKYIVPLFTIFPRGSMSRSTPCRST